MPFIDLKAQYKLIESQIKKRIDTVLDHGQYIMGPEVEEMEKELCKFTGSKFSVGCASGTDALLMALMALDIKAGDEVIIPDFSFFATAEVVSLIGAVPVFVDIHEDTYNVDPAEIEKHITKKTKAIMPVSLYGQCADFDTINAIASKHNIAVIEDGAQSFGASYKGKKSCNLTTIGCTSFFPSKPLGCYGDGGAVFTNDEKIATALREIRVHGQSGRYFHTRLGINGRIDSIQAAVVTEKMAIFEKELADRQKVAERYTQALKGKYKTPTIKEGNVSAYAQYTIEVDNRSEFQEKLSAKGVPTAVHYPAPLSKQPYYEGHSKTNAPKSVTAGQRVISLPFHPYMTEDVQNQVIESLLSL
ncbi:MAG: DegT/DnrJ/EryC1/StrS family aminotransferase [Halobacteriovoraceae bacterium]|nr:DegT/DnrJ/EryC1/StrS family aminotransferase [Halobacteriovoraceae bacterium]